MEYCHHLIFVAGVCKPSLFWSPISIDYFEANLTWMVIRFVLYKVVIWYWSEIQHGCQANRAFWLHKIEGENPHRISLKDWSVLYIHVYVVWMFIKSWSSIFRGDRKTKMTTTTRRSCNKSVYEKLIKNVSSLQQ